MDGNVTPDTITVAEPTTSPDRIVIDFLADDGPPCDVDPCSEPAVVRVYRDTDFHSFYSVYACLADELFVTDMFAAGHF